MEYGRAYEQWKESRGWELKSGFLSVRQDSEAGGPCFPGFYSLLLSGALQGLQQ